MTEILADNITISQGDCLLLMQDIADKSVDLIVTDPPYPREYEYLYEDLAREAKRVLRIGGSLVTLCGHYQLARILPNMSKYLKYRWIIKFDQPGSYARMAMGILVTWKPMLWFVNEKLSPKRNVIDSIVSPKKEKSSGHPWEQSESYALWAIENLTDKGDLVCDPFAGSFTTGVACIKTNRRFIGMELDENYYAIGRKRLQLELDKFQLPFTTQPAPDDRSGDGNEKQRRTS
jgi:site-specific DNA-methyltransferase (adenine-specific)